jgi:hypothetical protein
MSRAIAFPWATPPDAGEVRTVAPGILWARLPLPFRLNHVNVWLIEEDDGWTAIDTGCNDAITRSGKEVFTWLEFCEMCRKFTDAGIAPDKHLYFSRTNISFVQALRFLGFEDDCQTAIPTYRRVRPPTPLGPDDVDPSLLPQEEPMPNERDMMELDEG